MKKIILSILGFLVVVSLGFHTFLVHASDDITSPNFIVKLGNLDPLQGDPGRNTAPGGLSSFTTLLESITNILLVMIPIFAAISFLVAGYFYIFSAGDSEKAGRAKTIIKWNIIAMLVAFLSYGIIRIVASFFN